MKRILRILERVVKALLLLAVVTWVADWAVFRIESARGTGLDTVEVQQYLTTPLKGNKEEYDYEGTARVNCARALFPHSGTTPCWWLRRHPAQWE